LTGSLKPDTVIREQSKSEVVTELAKQLAVLAALYNIKDYTAVNASVLAEWIYETYQYEQLETVYKCLRNPPVTDERIWRLTPDVIRSWMLVYLDRAALEREKAIHNERFKEEPEGEVDPRLEEWLKELEKKETAVRPITEEEIKKEGGERPAAPKYIPPGKEYYVLKQLQIRYGRECTDLHTGRVKPGMPSFDEWLLMQK
jgi:hypothetical protein